MATIGWNVPSINTEDLAFDLLNNNMVQQGQAAYERMFWSSEVSDSVREGNLNARFGMDHDTFNQKTSQLDTIYTNLIGKSIDRGFLASRAAYDPFQQVYLNAIKNGWTQTDILAQFQQGDQFAGLRADQPWLATGTGRSTALSQYSSLYGPNPVDTSTLASWWRFNTEASQLTKTAPQASMSLGPLTSQQAEVH